MVKLSFVKNVIEMVSTEFHQQCSTLTGFSDFQMVDKLYMAANQVLCSKSCLCDAGND